MVRKYCTVLAAVDAKTGRPLWNTRVANASAGYAMTVAPRVVKDKVIVGVAGGEFGIRGFIAAYDVRTGREAWRFNTIPGPGEPGHETWQGQGDAWEHGGGAIWTTGSFDPVLNLTCWGTGNPGPDWNPASARATIFIRIPSSLSIPTPEGSSGFINSRLTIHTTTTQAQ